MAISRDVVDDDAKHNDDGGGGENNFGASNMSENASPSVVAEGPFHHGAAAMELVTADEDEDAESDSSDAAVMALREAGDDGDDDGERKVAAAGAGSHAGGGVAGENVESVLPMGSLTRTASSCIGFDRSGVDESQWYVNKWIDCRDSSGKWYEARVVAVRGDHVEVHFKGFADKWNEVVSIRSDRVAPLGSHEETRPKMVPKRDATMQMRPGCQIDAMDSIDKWQLAEIEDVDPVHMQVLVTYVGWSRKYDEWINTDSYRLAPLHTFVKPQERRIAAHRRNVDQSAEAQYRSTMRQQRGYVILDMAPDGNCLFRAIAHQVYGDQEVHMIVRRKCMEYIHSQRTFYSGYIDYDFDEYVRRMCFSGEWGGEIEVRAMGELYRRPIEIYAYSTQPQQVYAGLFPDRAPIRLSYHWNSHYNSLVNRAEHHKHVLNLTPGLYEDQSIRLYKAIGNTDEARAAYLELSVDERAEVQQLRTHMERARRGFGNRDMNDVMEQLLQSQIDEAKRISQSQAANAEMSDIERALQQSLVEKNIRGASSANSADDALARALKLSEEEFKSSAMDEESALVQQAMQASLLESAGAGAASASTTTSNNSNSSSSGNNNSSNNNSNNNNNNTIQQQQQQNQALSRQGLLVPEAVQTCISMGFREPMVWQAWTMFNDDKVAPDVMLGNMVRFLSEEVQREAALM